MAAAVVVWGAGGRVGPWMGVQTSWRACRSVVLVVEVCVVVAAVDVVVAVVVEGRWLRHLRFRVVFIPSFFSFVLRVMKTCVHSFFITVGVAKSNCFLVHPVLPVMACERVLELIRPATVLARDEAYEIECLCEASATWMSLHARDWINRRKINRF